jgi:tRNA A-37 threonylcarbamoyl transferase component Bud32
VSKVVSLEHLGAADTEVAAPGAATPENLGAAHTENASPHDTRPDIRAEFPPPGEKIGRYTVLQVLGRGGMGVVVSAYDPQLDRRVAIKLVASSAAAARAEFRERLVREARAMAKIRHPNVVSVYEVGEHEGQIYLAMEQVEGGTLRKRLRERRASGASDWREVLDDFIAAGRGLVAAHAAGMVHRDFKPENVFVDHDGRVLVGDFGLVGSQVAEAATDDELAESDSIHERLTRGDVVVGTPAYMALEQHLGEPVDARADQFAFCAALYEALCGALPFRGDTRKEYVRAIVREEFAAPPAGRRIPAWVHAALRRGLAAKAADRFPSMEALLAELGADPSREWRLGLHERLIAGGTAAGFLIAWAGVLLGLDVQLTYPLHYATNIGFLIVMGLLALVGRRVFARTSFNRKLIGFPLICAVMAVILVVGAQQLGMPPDVLGILHLLMLGSMVATASLILDRWLAPGAAAYLIGFLVTAFWPASFLPVLFVAHLVAAICLFIVGWAHRR